MPPHLWRCAGLRGHGGRLGWCLLAETLGLVPTGRPQEAAGIVSNGLFFEQSGLTI
jgi:hypothetical protein